MERTRSVSSTCRAVEEMASLRAAAIVSSSSAAWRATRLDSVPGAELDSPGLEALLDRLLAGDIDAIVVWKLDRLSRDQTNLSVIDHRIDEIGKRLGKRIAIVSATEGPIEDTPIGRLVRSMRAHAGEVERLKIVERTGKARREMPARGRLPHGKAPLSDKVVAGWLVVGPDEEVAIVERLNPKASSAHSQ